MPTFAEDKSNNFLLADALLPEELLQQCLIKDRHNGMPRGDTAAKEVQRHGSALWMHEAKLGAGISCLVVPTGT